MTEIEKLQEAIIELLDAGESMIDAAETCGHDDCIDDWKAAVRKTKKVFPEINKKTAEIHKKNQILRQNNFKKKEEAFRKKEQTEDAKILASFGLGLSADGKIIGLEKR